MYGIRKKQSKYRDIINQDVVILDDIFSQLLVMNANEDEIIYDSLMTYVKGDISKMGKCCNGAKALYFMYNLYDILDTNVTEKERGKHWVSVKVDLITAELAGPENQRAHTNSLAFRTGLTRSGQVGPENQRAHTNSLVFRTDLPGPDQAGLKNQRGQVLAGLDRVFWTGLTSPGQASLENQRAQVCCCLAARAIL
ncbi:hypothetical protein TIFTF001_037353 [Ficus carica]|uniref:Uncharacterized protein n=1 Tax=Ficus carica TaxID=3494 RepID=A0AA88E9M8_FICCA|nr:hypothetical protein TIFTF001_037353 [Ficus carica]